MVLCIVALYERRWAVCEVTVREAPHYILSTYSFVIGLQRGSVSVDWTDKTLDGGVCGDVMNQVSSTFFKDNLLCNNGKITYGLGIAAAVAMAGAAVTGFIIAARRSRMSLWLLALAAHVVGGVLAIAAGSSYSTKGGIDGMQCEITSVGPILMIAGHCSAHTHAA